MSIQTERPASKLQLGLMWSRMKKASRLDTQGVLELKTDTTATGQAVGVLVLAALSSGVGNAVFTQLQHPNITITSIIVGSLANMISACFAAFVWSATVFLVGTKLFQGRTRYWELARPLFFSTSPFILLILISIPIPSMIVLWKINIPSVITFGTLHINWIPGTVAIVASVWIVVSQVFALKQVMGFDIRRTMLTVAVGLLILAFIELQFGTG